MPAAAGEWDIKLIDVNGLTPKEETVATISVPLSVTNVDPIEGLNQLGGDILTLTGEGFDQVTDTTTVTFSDGTACIVLPSSATELTCMVDGFDPEALTIDTPYQMTVNVNGVEDAT